MGRPPGLGSRGAGATASFAPSSSGSPAGRSGRERGQPGSRAPERQGPDPDRRLCRLLPPARPRRRWASAGRDPCAAAARSALFRKEIKPLRGGPRPPRLLGGSVRRGRNRVPQRGEWSRGRGPLRRNRERRRGAERGEEPRGERGRRGAPGAETARAKAPRGRAGGAPSPAEVVRVGDFRQVPESPALRVGAPASPGPRACTWPAPASAGALTFLGFESSPPLQGTGSTLRTGPTLGTELRAPKPLRHRPCGVSRSALAAPAHFSPSLGAADPGTPRASRRPRDTNRRQEPRSRRAAAGLSLPDPQRGWTWAAQAAGDRGRVGASGARAGRRRQRSCNVEASSAAGLSEASGRR